MVIHDERIANLYYQEFAGLLNGMGVGITEAAGMQTACTLYPNPAADELTVAVEDITGKWLQLRDARGQLVLERQITGYTTRLDIGNLTSGIYLVQYGESLPARLIVR